MIEEHKDAGLNDRKPLGQLVPNCLLHLPTSLISYPIGQVMSENQYRQYQILHQGKRVTYSLISQSEQYLP